MKEEKYIHRTDDHNTQSPEQIVPVLIKLFNPKSVLDIGCGTGTFLNIFQKHGVEIMGVDGDWVNKEQLYINPSFFKTADLEKTFDLQKKFDLILCLELAEHLSETTADTLIDTLVNHGSRIIFSAAVKNQGGQNHINEQPFIYWQEKFKKRGFVFYDIFRPVFWNNENIQWWYKQNMFLAAHQSEPVSKEIENCMLKDGAPVYIHPGLLESYAARLLKAHNKLEIIQNGKAGISFYYRMLIKSIAQKFYAKK
jgi:SAM-dependent methyltransferase